jgi:hypothetical protein
MDNGYYGQGQQPSVPPPPSAPPAPPQPNPAVSQAYNQAYEKYQAKKELKKAIGASHEVLVSAQTIFPFVLFPDTITIDRGKLTISHRSFFKVAEVISIRIEDILNVTANVGPFFGSLQITTRFFGTGSEHDDKAYRINWLARDDALKIKRIAHGYITALQKEVDTSALSSSELAKLLLELGADSPDER